MAGNFLLVLQHYCVFDNRTRDGIEKVSFLSILARS